MRLLISSRRIQRSVALLLVFAWVHMLGACPCGCKEHSVWFRLMGMVKPSAQAAGPGSAVGSNNSDCTHQPRDLARSDECGGRAELDPRDQIVLIDWPANDQPPATFDSAFTDNLGFSPLAIPRSHARAVLQVFRL